MKIRNLEKVKENIERYNLYSIIEPEYNFNWYDDLNGRMIKIYLI